jgi:hypothetical protein
MPARALAQLGEESGSNKCSTLESETSDLAPHRNAVGRTTYSMKNIKEFTVLATRRDSM